MGIKAACTFSLHSFPPILLLGIYMYVHVCVFYSPHVEVEVDSSIPPLVTPPTLTLELRPLTSSSWRYVQSLSQNPRLRFSNTSYEYSANTVHAYMVYVQIYLHTCIPVRVHVHCVRNYMYAYTHFQDDSRCIVDPRSATGIPAY